MTTVQGEFIWYELITSDAEAAQAFYGPLLGWEFTDSGVDGVDYRMISKNGVQLAGLMEITSEMADGGARPCWLGYVSVDDPDAAAEQVAAGGGTVIMGPHDIPGDIGRFVFLADPQGAPIYFMRGNSDQDSQSFARYEPREGHCAWNELVTDDPDAAKTFYGDMLGWVKGDEMDMGPMGLYEMLRVSDYTFGAVMKRPEMMPINLWIYYFRVPQIEAAAELVTTNGGQVLTPPMQIPGGDYILQGRDPQGAFFALIGKGVEE